MTPEQLEQFEEMMRKVNEIYEYVQAAKAGQLPVNDNQRVLNGLGFIGRTGDTTPAGGLIVNTPEGPITLLRA